jgi:hypothetical protein
VQNINGSKIFAGLIVVTLNIASKFVTIKLSKSMESYLKHTFSRDVLIFCIVWMGSREIYIAFFVTLLFILFMDFLFNDDSYYCILPESFKDYHISLLEDPVPSAEDIKNAENVLERARRAQAGTGAGALSTDTTGEVKSKVVADPVSTTADSGFMPIKW